jgi:hypothetical protein
MERKRPLKVTKAFAVNPQDVETIKAVADQRATSDSEALRFIIDQYRLFLSQQLASVKEFHESNQAAA